MIECITETTFIEENKTLFQGSIYSLKQIGSKNVDDFLKGYLENYKYTHQRLGTYAGNDNTLTEIIKEDILHRDHSYYFAIYKGDELFITAKGTKRLTEKLRTETVFGFDLGNFLNVQDLSSMSLWHQSKTSVNERLVTAKEKAHTKDLLNILYYFLYSAFLNDKVDYVYGEPNKLGYMVLKRLGLDLSIVTPPKRTIGMEAFGVIFTGESLRNFIYNLDFHSLLEKYFDSEQVIDLK